MRVLFTIPHYVSAGEQTADGRTYGSLAADADARLKALTACLTALHQQFGAPTGWIHHGKRIAEQTPVTGRHRLDIVVCTTGGRHLLDRLGIGPGCFSHHPTQSAPPLLGFACHAVLNSRLGDYDYYCYLEDDLIVLDPWFFRKLAWFNGVAGDDDKLLQPNRFEGGVGHLVPKVYIDGDLRAGATAPFQDIHSSPPLIAEAFGTEVRFARTLNPHSGCFFLSARQMAHWAAQAHFNDHDSRFIGPLETCASLGIMRTFQVYRPVPANADFLEVQHAGTAMLERLCPPPEGAR